MHGGELAALSMKDQNYTKADRTCWVEPASSANRRLLQASKRLVASLRKFILFVLVSCSVCSVQDPRARPYAPFFGVRNVTH